MEKRHLDAFERQGISPELRTEEHFFFESDEKGEIFAVPREISINDETYVLLATGGLISEQAVVTNSEIGPRSIIKGLSIVLNSTIEKYSIEDSVIADSTIVDPFRKSQSIIKNTSIGIKSTVIASDIHDSNIGGHAEIGPYSSIQDTNIGDSFIMGGGSYILGESSRIQYVQSGTCDIKDNVQIGNDTTIHAGVSIGNDSTIGSSVKIEEYTDIRQKTYVEDFVKIGACARIGKESYILNRSIIDSSKTLQDRTFIYHNFQDTDYETMSTRHMFRHVIKFMHNFRARYNKDSPQYDTYWLMSDKRRPY